MDIVNIIIGLILLVVGGEFLVRSSVGLSFKLNISKMVIGMTVVSFATSAPELLVSLNAALSGSPAIAINNVIGSNIANIGLVLAVTAVIGPIAINKDFYKLNYPVMMLFSVALFFMLKSNDSLNRFEGISLFVGLALFLIILVRNAEADEADDKINDKLATTGYGKIFFWLAIGAASLYFGSEFLVDGAKGMARNFGISEGVISITMIAIGTSVPELAASVIAAVRGEKAISLGNLIGSNIFNIGSVLGLTSIVKIIPVTEPQILSNDIFWMLGFAAVLLPLALLPKKHQFSRIKGSLILISYIVFIYLVFQK